jgi:hypothetical protein
VQKYSCPDSVFLSLDSRALDGPPLGNGDFRH